MEFWYHVLVLLLIFVQFQGISNERRNCGCCKTGQNLKCRKNHYCSNGCLVGYSGRKCNKKCRYTNCARCKGNRNFKCKECKTGYYGSKCDFLCGSQCKTCHKRRGCTECNTGYYGANCQHFCEYDSSENNTQSGCIACNTGYYLKKDACIKCRNTGCICTLNTECHGSIDDYLQNQELCEKCPKNVYCAPVLPSALHVRMVDLEICVSIDVEETASTVIVCPQMLHVIVMPILSERGVTSVSRVISVTIVNRNVLQHALIHVQK
ncbi:hypothetical protein MAR_031368 [Mya arenaria]|uniref:Uncharacterized protein n=1 Tax=Mya arenaria TaxID=6604 RepID=A0ABY7F7L9_MYAAR|nr:hypothetical protein MAR_031368 [Mya arenaria]